MNQKIKSIWIVLFGLFSFLSALSVHADESSLEPKNELVVYFKSKTFDVDQKSIDDIIEKMDPRQTYRIQGYACSNDEKTQEYLLLEAERRAGIVRNLLIQKGFPSNKLCSIAYDHNSECKVILKAIE